MTRHAGGKRKPPIKYEDFDLQLGFYQAEGNQDDSDGTFKVWTTRNMTPEEAIYRTYKPKDFWDDPILGIGGLLGRLEERKLSKKEFHKLGRLLADLALPDGPVRTCFKETLSLVTGQGKGLRLRLHITPPELAQLPWEFMMLPRSLGEPQDTDFLALRPEISIVRTDTSGVVKFVPPAQVPIRLVGVLSCPKLTDPLNLARDQAGVNNAVAACNQQAKKNIVEVPTWIEGPDMHDNLVQALKNISPDIFHYSGHATFELNQEGKFLLEGPNSERQEFPATTLVVLLCNAGVRLVVLSACETGRRNGRVIWSGVAPALTREKIPAVVANQFDILDSNASLLAELLYPRLLAGCTIDEAIFEVRQAMYSAPQVNANVPPGLENRDWGTLVLYLQAEDGMLFPFGDIQKGFQALAYLMQKPEVLKVVHTCQGDIRTAYDQIEDVYDYKIIHDQLHYLEFTYYQSIVKEAKHFPGNESVDNLNNLASNLEKMIMELQVVVNRKALPCSELKWIDKIKEAHTKLDKALKDNPQALKDAQVLKDRRASLDQAILLLHMVLDTHPAYFNSRLYGAAQAMRLKQLGEAMAKINEILNSLPSAERDKVDQFKSSKDSLSKFNSNFLSLVEDHNNWQFVDMELRRIEKDMKPDLKDLLMSWPSLKAMVVPLCADIDADWVQKTQECCDELDKVFVESDTDSLSPSNRRWARNCFHNYRRQLGNHFYNVDLTLKEQCGKLQNEVGKSLEVVLNELGRFK